MNFEQIEFKSNPKFKFKEIISDKNEGFSISSLFEIYKDKDDDIVIASGFLDVKNPYSTKYISIISLKNNKRKKQLLYELNERVRVIRYFINPKTKNAYLASVGINCQIVIWDINKDYQIFFNHKFESYYANDILMLFINNNINIIIPLKEPGNTIIMNVYSKNEIQIEKIENILELTIYNLSYWYNIYNDKHYIIYCGQYKVLIYEYNNKENYATIETDNYPVNLGSIVYTRNNIDYLCFSSQFGLIIIYDLLNRNIVKRIEIENAFLINIVKWNHKYLLTIDDNKKSIIVIDLYNNKIISLIKIPEIFSHERYLRKVIHPLYGESLISIGNDWKIKLYTI